MNRIKRVYMRVLGISLAVGFCFWIIDAYYEFVFFHDNLTFLLLEGPETFLEFLIFRVPRHSIFLRSSFVIACVLGGLLISVFLSRRKKAELLLQENEAKFRALIQAIPDLVWLKDKNGVYLACNPRFEAFFGAKETDIIGKTDYDFVDAGMADSFRRHDKIAMVKGMPQRNEEEITFADDGHCEVLETVKNPMFKANGQLAGVLGVGRDITERKKAEAEREKLEAQLVQSRKMESVGRLAGGVAHDYNNILSVILGYAELALDKVDLHDPVHAFLEEILIATRRSTDITRQLLAFARKQTISPRVLDLNKSVEGMLKMLRQLIGEDIDLVWHPRTPLWTVNMDPSQLDQIMVNLCINARDAIGGVGKVRMETDQVTFDSVYCADHPEFVHGEFVLLVISDTGKGMDKKILDNLFEPFFTTKEVGQGTGLGMATVYGIVKQNNGFINVYSEPGKGTIFRIYLPRHGGKVEQIEARVPDEIPRGRGETILVVEDDAAILKLTHRILDGLGYHVLMAENPLKAIELVGEHAGRIDLLFTDVVMPEMNGHELSLHLRSLYPDLEVLFMSGYTANVIAHRGVLEQGVCFISKPFSKKDLALKIRNTLDKANIPSLGSLTDRDSQ